MPGTLRFVLGDQLSRGISSLRGLDPAADTVLLAEVAAETEYVPHHPKKIALILAAMRHFSAALRADGVRVDHVRLDDPGNSGSFRGELLRAVERHRPDRVVVTFPGEWRVWTDMKGWEAAAGVPVEIRDDDRFFCPPRRFRAWAAGRRQLRMEFFYREMRRETGLLLTPDGEPEGGAWNYDTDNRKPLPRGLEPPPRFDVRPDALTAEVLALVRARFAERFGELEPFRFAVTAAGAEAAFEHFVRHALRHFGDYQDAMAAGQDTLFHAVISPYLNIGLLDPRAVCRRVEAEYRAGRVPLNAAEGFIRQILGWREYVRGLYWLRMPDYAETNALGAVRDLPPFFWTGETPMTCLREVIGQTRREAYAHHIQRLMVTGNFALLAGLAPRQVEEWYLAVYADAFDWVELPNVHGMVLHADGGVMASKPYAASGKYIDRMSDYCGRCRFDVRRTTGADACPLNFLYWTFLMDQRERLQGNPRMAMIYRTLDRMAPATRDAVRADAARFLAGLGSASGPPSDPPSDPPSAAASPVQPSLLEKDA
ncbi:cryptochrome/photolyase family protein [Rhodospirillum centenum]|uniref:Deoxyribodipyrimidine photolyase-like protein n=1 Tax=Rhodospirillum centenum (strain ATCC 51521 / SW) TaxID=414684 RepID=B6IRE2_RHOCS|nr:cryptochrome/photolyase family protein [Rhodospirillum centenum]ACI98028.1 deoxyribodipyrimidine photolyase-like protein [Rhodospirillum centenum SW]